MPLSVYFKTPLTDLTGITINNQYLSDCSRLEEKSFNCVEAYGAGSVENKCKDLIEDFHECVTKTKQRQRAHEMMLERDRQVAAGTNKYAEGPKHDSYQSNTRLG